MMHSGQIAAMMSQQNQGFAGNMAYSQQISQGMPGAYGQGGGGFNYGGGMSTQAMGNAVGDRAMSAGAGVASFGGALASGMATHGAAMAGFGAARLGGAGFMAAAGVGAVAADPIYAGFKALQHVGGSMMSGARQQAAMDNTLGGFQMANTGTSGGSSFNRDQSKHVGDMVRQMSSLPEMMTSMGELTKIMDKMGQSGMMQ